MIGCRTCRLARVTRGRSGGREAVQAGRGALTWPAERGEEGRE